ncbi:ThiJ/PfpI [Cordyceps militaris CM01]|uniref:ThiJ/PfpI n=1 Tax=Cordyceps militaris (strain CM01) TaxID=983644 RepID=G3JBN1_CORMM|nr:ThiJ/PfpI [Cordyceps militaris CM01]EGX95336.1 ThiJ/PfpI [Cordyceps militaris CM01]
MYNFGCSQYKLQSNPPRNFGVVMYNSFDLLDISGSVEPLFLLSSQQRLNLSLIAETLEPVHMRPAPGESYTAGSHFQLSINPTHTFADPPPDIDVLFVPGGGGERFGDNSAAVDFVRRTYPKVRYLITVCTGAGVAAQAGVLDGKRATTNKWAWKDVVSNGNNVQWTSPARWVVDGNIWTASGVVSGIDVIFEFMETFYGEEIVRLIQNATEHKRTYDPCDDPFAAWNKVPPSGDCRLTPYLHHE